MALSTLTTLKSFKVEDITHRPEEPVVRVRGFEPVSPKSIDHLLTMTEFDNDVYASGSIKLPKQSSKDSAGYDFYLPLDIEIPCHSSVTVWTNVKSYNEPGEMLFFTFKKYLQKELGLDVAIADITDEDYGGNIGMFIFNSSSETRSLSKGTKVVQSIFIPCLLSDNCNRGV